MAKKASLYPSSIDVGFNTDRQSEDIFTSDAWDLMESALKAIETELGTDPAGASTDVKTLLAGVTAADMGQIANIGPTTTISAGQWGYLGSATAGMGQLMAALTTGESTQLEAIGATTISATQWGYLGACGAGGGQLLAALTAAESDQLELIGTTTISAAQWGYLGAMNQGVATTDFVTLDRVLSTNYTSKINTTANDDAAISHNPTDTTRFFFLVTGSGGQYYFGHCNYSASTTLQNSGFTKLDGVLAGTTGVDGNISIGVSVGVVYIENRSGGGLDFSITILGGMWVA